MHSLSVAPEPLAIWNKKLEGLEFELFEELRTSPVVAPEHISRLFCSGRTWLQCLGIFSGSLLVVRCSYMVVVECKCLLFMGCTVLVYSPKYACC